MSKASEWVKTAARAKTNRPTLRGKLWSGVSGVLAAVDNDPEVSKEIYIVLDSGNACMTVPNAIRVARWILATFSDEPHS